MVGAFAALIFAAAGLQDAVRSAGCDPVGKARFICGLESPEDLVAAPGTDWIVVSGYEGSGGLRLANARDGRVEQALPTARLRTKPDTKTYPQCASPPVVDSKERFNIHGLNVRRGPGRVHTLYGVYHGPRESIEVFEIDTAPAVPVFTWIGCVVAPPRAGLNGVAPLPGEGLVATNPYPRDDTGEARTRARAGQNTGDILEWHTSTGWTVVPGSEAPAPNGIEVSQKGDWLYVNMWPVKKMMRLSRGRTPVRKDVIDVPFHPDNLRWHTDGTLISAGHHAPTIPRAVECLRVACHDAASRVARIDPGTMRLRLIVDYPSHEVFFGATAAMQVGDEIWIGAVGGSRVARHPIE
jgi:hypothetical protein